MKRLLLYIAFLLLSVAAFAQPRYAVLKIPQCWTTPGAVDSSINRVVLVTTQTSAPTTLYFTNADNNVVTVSGGSLKYGYCDCCGDGSGTSGVIAFNGLTQTGDTVKFGGVIVEETALDGGGYNFTWENTDTLTLTAEVLQLIGNTRLQFNSLFFPRNDGFDGQYLRYDASGDSLKWTPPAAVDTITTFADTTTISSPKSGDVAVLTDGSGAAFWDGSKWWVVTGTWLKPELETKDVLINANGNRLTLSGQQALNLVNDRGSDYSSWAYLQSGPFNSYQYYGTSSGNLNLRRFRGLPGSEQVLIDNDIIFSFNYTAPDSLFTFAPRNVAVTRTIYKYSFPNGKPTGYYQIFVRGQNDAGSGLSDSSLVMQFSDEDIWIPSFNSVRPFTNNYRGILGVDNTGKFSLLNPLNFENTNLYTADGIIQDPIRTVDMTPDNSELVLDQVTGTLPPPGTNRKILTIKYDSGSDDDQAPHIIRMIGTDGDTTYFSSLGGRMKLISNKTLQDISPRRIIETDSATFDIQSTGNFFSDNRAAPKGIEYPSDYTATLTDNSLIPKRYVDSQKAFFYQGIGQDTVAGGGATNTTLDLGGTEYVNETGFTLQGDTIVLLPSAGLYRLKYYASVYDEAVTSEGSVTVVFDLENSTSPAPTISSSRFGTTLPNAYQIEVSGIFRFDAAGGVQVDAGCSANCVFARGQLQIEKISN